MDATTTEAAPTTTPAAEPAKTEPVTVKDRFTDVKARAREAEKPPAVEAKPAEKPVDPDLAAVTRILEQDRRVKAEAKRVSEERAALNADRERDKAERATAIAAKEAIGKRDAIGALRALGFTDAEIYDGDDSILFKLAEARVNKPQLDAATQIESAIAAKLAEREEAEKAALTAKEKVDADAIAAKQAEAEAFTAQAKVAYAENVTAIAAANIAKYPTLAAFGVTNEVVANYAWNVLVNSRGETVISEEQALADMESHYAEKARAAVGTTAAESTRTRPGVTPAWSASAGSPGKEQPRDLRGKFEALKERARASNKK